MVFFTDEDAVINPEGATYEQSFVSTNRLTVMRFVISLINVKEITLRDGEGHILVSYVNV